MEQVPDRLRRDAAERVLRRAVELADQPGDRSDQVPLQALLDAAAELDIGADRVRLAVAEERLGLLSAQHRRTDALVGPDRVLRARVVAGEPAEVLERVDAWMRRGRVLRRIRRSVDEAAYARRSDPLAAAQRALRAAGGHEQLAHVKQLRVLVSPAGNDRTLVGLLVDLRRSRTAAAAGGVAVAATGTVTAGVSALTWVPWAWLGVPVAAAGGIGVLAARKAWVGGVAPELEALLDAVASGAVPGSVLEDLAGRLLGGPRSTPFRSPAG